MFYEDNNGYVNFPTTNKLISVNPDGKTLVYLVAFEPTKFLTDLSNVFLQMPGNFVSDDVVQRPKSGNEKTIDELISNETKNSLYDSEYFPEINSDLEILLSKDFVSSICIGWHNNTFEYTKKTKFWHANFDDLTKEGRRLYFSIKKLHNNKEVRILTFNCI